MADNKKNRSTVDVSRSSISGRFVTEQYAKRNPRITEQERIRKK